MFVSTFTSSRRGTQYSQQYACMSRVASRTPRRHLWTSRHPSQTSTRAWTQIALCMAGQRPLDTNENIPWSGRERRAKGWQHTLAWPNLQLFDMHPASPTSCVASHGRAHQARRKKARKYQQRAHATSEPASAPPSESKQAVGGLQKSRLRRSRCGTGRRATCVHVAGTVMGACTGCGGKSPGNGLSAQHRDLSSSFPRHPPSSATSPLSPAHDLLVCYSTPWPPAQVSTRTTPVCLPIGAAAARKGHREPVVLMHARSRQAYYAGGPGAC